VVADNATAPFARPPSGPRPHPSTLTPHPSPHALRAPDDTTPGPPPRPAPRGAGSPMPLAPPRPATDESCLRPPRTEARGDPDTPGASVRAPGHPLLRRTSPPIPTSHPCDGASGPRVTGALTPAPPPASAGARDRSPRPASPVLRAAAAGGRSPASPAPPFPGRAVDGLDEQRPTHSMHSTPTSRRSQASGRPGTSPSGAPAPRRNAPTSLAFAMTSTSNTISVTRKLPFKQSR